MPSYCSSFQSVNSVPPVQEMELFKPYCVIGDGVTSFDVVFKVPSNCYFISGNFSGAPSGGPCGDPTDLNHVIEIDQTTGCSNADETVLSVTLTYTEDPSGNPLNMYIVDKSNGDSTSGNVTRRKVY